MIKKFLLFIKHIFIHHEEVTEDNNYSDVGYTSSVKIQPKINKVITHNISPALQPNARRVVVKKINKRLIDNKIKKNIFFIDDLMEKMFEIPEYLSYYNKLKDLKTQSQNSLRILYRMSEDAPYYYNTVKAIINHTNTISKLIED